MFNAKISYKTCERIVWLEPGMLLVMVLAAETLLVMRVWALWDRAWWVPCIFVIMVAAEIGISIFALGESTEVNDSQAEWSL